MRRIMLACLAAATGCAEGNPENNPVCGFAALAGASMVLEQFAIPGKILTELPDGVEGIVPARVVGRGTARALAGTGPEGAVLGYEGEGFPAAPGFALAMVEDSLETFQGILIFETEPPRGVPQLGTISSQTTTLPLFGLRVTWNAVSSERCPLFAPLDTSDAGG